MPLRDGDRLHILRTVLDPTDDAGPGYTELVIAGEPVLVTIHEGPEELRGPHYKILARIVPLPRPPVATDPPDSDPPHDS